MFNPKSGTYCRRIGQKTFVPGGGETFQIPRGDDIAAVIVEITGTVQLTTAATTVSEFGSAMLIQSLQLAADGSKRFAFRTGLMSALGNFELALAREIVNPGTGIATHTVYAQHVIDLATFGGPRPKDSALHTSAPYMSLLDLTLAYGQILDMYSVAGAAVVGAVNLTVNVYVEYYQERNGKDLTEQRYIRRVTPFEIRQTSANALWQQQLPIGTYLRGIKMITFDQATAKPVSAARINSIRLRAGSDTRRENITVGFVRGQNRREFETCTYLDTFPTLMYLDLLSADGSLTDLWDLRRATDAFLELDIAANTWVQGEFVTYDFQPALGA